MMAFNAVLEVDLRAISAESRRKFPAVKDAAEHAILMLRSLSDAASIASCNEVVKIFLMACETRQVKLSTLGLSCLQKLIAHDAVAPPALPSILAVLKEHAESFDDGVQLKVLQTVLTVLQSRLHPDDEENMAIMLGICLRLLGNSRNVDTVHSTASATLRQAVALIFDRVLEGEGLMVASSRRLVGRARSSSSSTGPGDVSRIILASAASRASEGDAEEEMPFSPASKESLKDLSQAARLGLLLFEDLHALAAGQPAVWLHVPSLPRAFALDMLEYVISHYLVVFKKLGPFEQVLRQRVCSLLMTSLRTSGEMEGEGGEPSYRRLVLRSVATVTRLYSSIMMTECEVFLTMLIKSMDLDLPLWHRIMVLEVLRGFCVEPHLLRLIFQTFDMRSSNTDIVADMVLALARVVQTVQIPEASEESLAAVAGMFSSKAKGVEWTMDFDLTGNAVVVASEAHAITLAIEGLLGVVFTIAILTDEAVDEGELVSPRDENAIPPQGPIAGGVADMCARMVESVWRTLLEALSLMLSRSQGEAVVLEILKGYQAFTTACGVLRMAEPRDSFLESLCSFTLVQPLDIPKTSTLAVLAAGMKRLDPGGLGSADQAQQQQSPREGAVLTPKNVQALRTLFNVSHRLGSVLGASWEMVLSTLAALDRTIHSPHATTQEVSVVVPRLSREGAGQSSDFNILSTLDDQLFESSAMMGDAAVRAVLAALRNVSLRSLEGVSAGLGSAASGSTVATGAAGGSLPSSAPKMFAVERMLATLAHNLYRVDRLWGELTVHLLELADHESPQVRMVALDAFDRAIMAVLNCGRIREDAAAATRAAQENHYTDVSGVEESATLGSSVGEEGELPGGATQGNLGAGASASGQEGPMQPRGREGDMFECVVIMPLTVLYDVGCDMEVRSGALRVLLHVLERHGEKLYHSWPDILELLRLVASAEEKDHVPLGFQSVRVIMNDCLSSVPATYLEMCVEVAGAYAGQKADINISLTAIGLLWTTADFIVQGLQAPSTVSTPVPRRASDGLTSGRAAEVGPSGPGRPAAESAPLNSSPGSVEGPAAGGVNLPLPDGALPKRAGNLVLGVFGVIQGLGTDERPEVRNSAIRTLFQSIVSHGGKLSHSQWHHCLFSLMLPLVQSVRHLAASASQDEWLGTEIGKSAGKSVHMLVHHSRNTAQKQWDETLVIAFNGVSRLLRSFFPFLQTLDGFRKGWAALLQFVEESVLAGSKEVAGAAVAALHVVLHAHAPRGTLPRFFWESAFATYEVIVRGSAHAGSRVPLRARQDVLQNLGELYCHSAGMFEPEDYLKALALLDVLARFPHHPGEPVAYAGTLPQVQRTVLEVLAKVAPSHPKQAHLWPCLLRQLLAYLPGGDHLLCNHCRVPASFLPEHINARRTSEGLAVLAHEPESTPGEATVSSPRPENGHRHNGFPTPGDEKGQVEANSAGSDEVAPSLKLSVGTISQSAPASPGSNAPGALGGAATTAHGFALGGQLELFAPSAVWSGTAENKAGSFMLGFPETAEGALSHVFVERVVVLLLELFRQAPPAVKASTLPDFIAALGRCMAVRRDSPISPLWRTALGAFIEVLDLAMLPDGNYLVTLSALPGVSPRAEEVAPVDNGWEETSGSGRPRLWKEVAGVFEKFLLGACGRATTLSGSGQVSMSPEMVKLDEELEGQLLDALCDKVLLCCADAAPEVRQRLVSVIDQCAGRTSALPLGSVVLLPAHCGRFSTSCLRRLFYLTSRASPNDSPECSAVLVGQISLPLLVCRCESILQRYTLDMLEKGTFSLPGMRLEEVVLMLQELARLVLSPQVASAVDVPICPKDVQAAVDAASPRTRGSAREPTTVRFHDDQGYQLGWQRAHLLLLYTPLCEVVLAREPRVAELVRVLLRLIGNELGLLKEVQRTAPMVY